MRLLLRKWPVSTTRDHRVVLGSFLWSGRGFASYPRADFGLSVCGRHARHIFSGGKRLTRENTFSLLKNTIRTLPTSGMRLRWRRSCAISAGDGLSGRGGFLGDRDFLLDLDFEQFPEQHCVQVQELMREAGVDERTFHACADGWGMWTPSSRSTRWKKCFTRWTNDRLIGAVVSCGRRRAHGLEGSPLKRNSDAFLRAGCSRGG